MSEITMTAPRLNLRVRPLVAKLAGGLASLTIAGALMAGVQGSTAYAANWSSTGHPGAVQIPVEQARTNSSTYPQLIFPSRFAWRSSSYSTSTQVISVKYAIFKWNLSKHSWPLYTWATSTATVPVGYSGAWLGSWAPSVDINSVYFVSAQVKWTTTAGTVIGTTTIVYDMTSDYQCLTPTTCYVQTDPTVGADVYLAF
jgi:hypothetical protein